MPIFNARYVAFIVTLLTLMAAPLLSAQPDAEAALYITADDVMMDEAKGVSVYRGHVMLEQEGIRLQAVNMSVYYSDDRVEKIIATGDPVRYHELRSNGRPMTALGERLEYSVMQKQIVMSGNAQVENEGNLLQGHSILYNLTDSTARVLSDSAGARVKTVIEPSSELFKEK